MDGGFEEEIMNILDKTYQLIKMRLFSWGNPCLISRVKVCLLFRLTRVGMMGPGGVGGRGGVVPCRVPHHTPHRGNKAFL